MESQEKKEKDENLFTQDHDHDFSSGPLAAAPDDDEEDEADELDEAEKNDDSEDD